MIQSTKPNNLNIGFYGIHPLIVIPVGYGNKPKMLGLAKCSVILKNENTKIIAQYVKDNSQNLSAEPLVLEKEKFSKFNNPLALTVLQAIAVLKHIEDIKYFMAEINEVDVTVVEKFL